MPAIKTTELTINSNGVYTRSLFTMSLNMVPDMLEDLIDEMDCNLEREIIQRYLCIAPLYSDSPNSERGISREMNIPFHCIRKAIKKFKMKVWNKVNGKNINNN